MSAVEEEVGTLWVQASHRDKLTVFEGQPKGPQEAGEAQWPGRKG